LSGTFIPLLFAEARNRIASIRHADAGDRLRGLLFLVLLVAFVLSADFLAHRLFRALLGVGDIGFELIGMMMMLRLLGLLFLIVMALLFFGGMIAAMDTLYFADDLDFLASRPIPRRAILGRKFVSLYLTSAWMVFLVVTPVMTAYDRAVTGGIANLPKALIGLMAFTVPPVALSAIVVMILMRIFPIDRAREAVLGAGALLGFAMLYLYRLLSPARLFDMRGLVADAAGFIRSFTMPLGEWMPSNVMAQTLVLSSTTRPAEYGASLAWLVGGAALSLLLYMAFGLALHRTDRPVSGRAAAPGFIERGLGIAPLLKRVSNLAPARYRGLLYKELIGHLRDPLQISHLFLIAGIAALHLVNLTEMPWWRLHPGARVLIAFLNLGLVGFLAAAVAGRFIYPSMTLEGRPWWTIATAPVSPEGLVAMKFLVGWIPLALVSVIVIAWSNASVGISGSLAWLWAGTGLVIATAVAALGTAIGIRLPAPGSRNVFEISSSQGGIIFMLAAMLHVGTTIVILVRPAYDALFVSAEAYRANATLAGAIILAGGALVVFVSWRWARGGMRDFAARI
jgi:ABC-2 type transport system permease protein